MITEQSLLRTACRRQAKNLRDVTVSGRWL